MGDPFFPVYELLWREIQANEHVWALLYSRDPGWDEEGSFAPDGCDNGRSQITIVRTSYLDPPTEPSEFRDAKLDRS